jgi:PAS domain S-box-containing protein
MRKLAICIPGSLYGPARTPRLPFIAEAIEVRVATAYSTAAESELFAVLVQTIQDYAIFALNPAGNVLTWNSGARAIKGYEKSEIVGKHFSIFYPEEARQSGWPNRELAIAEKEGRFSDEGWRVRKDGTVFWASVLITAMYDSEGKLTGFAKVTRDLTERRRFEERFQALNKELRNRVQQLDESQRLVEFRTMELQKLSGQLLRAQDEERRRIARDLHDDLGQRLAGLKMAISRERNPDLIEMIDSALLRVRNLSYLLHPPLLDEAGLLPALHWLVDGMVKRSGIHIAFTTKPSAFPRLTEEAEVTIFRVIQESLTNVYRHSKSESAKVELELQPDWIVIRIRDYGKGLPPSPTGSSTGSISVVGVGIAGMRERLRQFGGELVVSTAEPGTLVEARIPAI